jgi:hypothetical protein
VRGIAEFGAGARSGNPTAAGTAAVRRLLPRWGYTAALVVGLTALFMSPSGRDIEDLAQLERLAPKIERAQSLSSEAREAIERLIARQSTAAGPSDRMLESRRKVAIERVTSAMKARESVPAGSNVAAR